MNAAADPAPDPTPAIRAALDRLAGDMPSLGVAVSGGGDSVALMRIMAGWACGRRIMVATVDHGLRENSADEARQVADMARSLGLPHETLRWQPDGMAGNLMANARDARLRLLSDWGRRNDLAAVALGHTADDRAETLMMRLARGSGIDGLAAMAEWRDAFGTRWLRPMLGAGRAELRDWLRAQDITWIDDPSNDKDEFERVRIRKAIAAMDLDIAALSRAAAHIAEARDALSHYALLASEDAVARNGSLTLLRRPLSDAPVEIRRRLLVAACRWITGADYPPRRAAVLHALNAVATGNRVTLDGSIIEPCGDRLRILREPAAALRAAPSTDGIWDNRWKIGGLRPGQHVAAVGFTPLPALNWRLSGLGRDEAAASPAIWQGDRLIAAPLLRPCPPFRSNPLRGPTEFRKLVMAH